jgi:hypothetical protein
MEEDEQQLDAFLQKASSPEDQESTAPPEQSEEDVVEKKARQGKPIASTVLQNKSVLSESQLEQRIAGALRKHAGTLDEGELRQRIADHLDANGDITEADFATILNGLLAANEQEEDQQNQPFIAPPPIVTSSIQAAQQHVTRAADWASSLATPGGVGFLIFVLVFFIWVIVPVSSGHTRLQLLWGMLTGQVQFSQQYRDAEQTAATAQFGSADFAVSAPAQSPNLSIIPFEV